jgi:cytoskeletal protein CcmA (bactofilin family)
MAYPEPTEVSPWYLRNITQALELDTVTGQVHVRSSIVGGNVTIAGSVIVSNVTVDAIGNIDVSGNTMPVSGNVVVSGNVNANVSGNVVITSGNVNANVSGNVNANVSGNVNANITGGNVTVTQGTDPWVVSGNVIATLPSNSNVIISGFSGATSDAFGRLRVSEPFTLFDTQSRYYDHGQFDSSTSGTASVTYVSAQSSFQLNVGSASGDSVIRETKRVFPYQPGKSQLTLNTFCMNTPKTNLRQRVGLFGANDGIFFENDGTYNYMVIRSGSTGVEERVRQDAWNGDRLTGAGGATNPSGYTLYPDRTQIFYADVEWLGVGSVRVGFVINGAYILCHTFNHANQSGNTKVYMTTATLPIRYEITNTGSTSGASMMTQICSTVISEGGYTEYGVTEAAGTGINEKRLSLANTFYPIVSIRLAPGRKDSIVLPTQLDFLSTSVNYYQYKLLLNTTLTGATWTGTSETGSVQYDTGATAVSGGTQIQSGYVSSRTQLELSALSFFQFQLGRTIAGVSDVVTLVMATTSPNADILAQLGWQELT